MFKENFGDYIDQFIFDQIGMVFPAESMLGCGSLLESNHLGKFPKDAIVWGSGSDGSPLKKEQLQHLNIYSVRGPLTRQKINIDCDLGDPGFLIPCFIKPRFKKDRITYIPHWANYDKYKRNQMTIGENLLVNPFGIFEQIIDDINSSSFVMTNSLHGAIVAQAYNIPWAPVKTKQETMPNIFKWHDLFLYLGLDFKPYFVSNYKEAQDWWKQHGDKIKKPEIGQIIGSFPWRDHLVEAILDRDS